MPAAIFLALAGAMTGAAPAMATSAVVVGRDRIEVRKAIPFAAASAVVPASSFPLLKELARALKENPQFTKVRIEGHTDSTGDTERNRLLSQQRADAVRLTLVNFGVGQARLTALGFGASDPLQSNATELGRSQNRRVVFEVLQVGGKKVERPPLAKVSARRNKVDSRAPLEQSWRNATVGDGLKRSWRVRTNLDSGAGITFRDASRIDMREETLVIIFGATESTARKQPMRASLQTGALTAWLSDQKGRDAPLLVETPSGDGELLGGRATVRTRVKNQKRESAFSNHSGKPATIFGKDKSGGRLAGTTKIDAGYGSRVKAGKNPDAAKKLPSSPKVVISSPIAIGIGTAGAVATGTWTVDATATHLPGTTTTDADSSIDTLTLVMQSREHADASPARITVPNTTKDFRIENLPPGTYTLQASVVDAIGLESDLSPKQTLRAVQLGRVDASSEDDGKVTAGEALIAPDRLRCAVDAIPFDDTTALVVRPTSRTIRCLPNDGDPAKDTSVAALVVKPLPAVDVLDPGLVAGRRSALVIQSATPLDATYDVDIGGATLKSLNRQQDASGRREIVINVDANAERVELRLRRRGVVIKTFALAVKSDAAAPVISRVDIVRNKTDPSAIDVAATVVDKRSGVASVSVGVTGTPDVDATPMARVPKSDRYIATLPAPSPEQPQSLTVGARDQAGNELLRSDDAVKREVPPAPVVFNAWWLAIPVGIAIPLVIAGGAFSADAAQYRLSADGPFIGRFVDDALGRTDDAGTLALVEGATGATFVIVGLATAVAAGAGLILLNASEAAAPSE